MPPRARTRQQTLDEHLSHPSSSRRAAPATGRRTRQPVKEPEQDSDSSAGDSDMDALKAPAPSQKKAVIILTDSSESSEEKATSPVHGPIDLSSDSQSSDDSEDSLLANSASNRVRKSRKKLSSSSEASDDASPRKRRKIIKGNPGTLPSDEDLVKELDSDTVLETRLRGPRKSKYSQNLEKMKRAKALRSLSPEEKESELSEDSRDSGDDDIIPGAVPPGHRLMTSSDSDEAQGDDEEDGFIIEDDDEVVALPLEFSSKSHSDLSHHFKILCQLFVHLAVTKESRRSAFMRKSLKDEYFSVPLNAVRRKIKGTNDSMVASSIWKSHFRKRLDVHPVRQSGAMDYSTPLCDACHISNRIATQYLVLSGLPYDRDTFEAILPDSDDDSDAEEEEQFRADGVRFVLGRFCARRARLYHILAHWEHALYTRLHQEVRDVQNPSRAVRVNYGSHEIPEDTNDPDQIMDWLDRRKVISDEYDKIKGALKEAQTLDAPGHHD